MLGRVPIRGTSEDCWCRLLYEPDALPVAQNNSVKTPNELSYLTLDKNSRVILI